MGRKNTIKKGRARVRKSTRTPGQRAKDAKAFACGRKVWFATKAEADEVGAKMQHRSYLCDYGKDHYHLAHLPGSRRFVRGVPA